MLKRKSTFVLMVALLCVASLIASCGPAADPTPTDPDVSDPTPAGPQDIIVALSGSPKALCAWRGTSVGDQSVANLIHFGLLEWDENLVIEPLAAKEILFPDETTIVFELHEGIFFHDGVEMTSADVKYTYDLIRDADFAAQNRGFYTPIKEITTPDDYTVEFHLHEPNAPMLYYMSIGIMPKHIGEEHGEEWMEENAVGIGPYQLVEWVMEERIVIEAFDDCFWGRPAIDSITYRMIPEMATRVIELEAGSVHVIDWVAPEEVERLKDHAEIRLDISPGSGMNYLFANVEKPPLDDLRVRKALAYLFDQEKMVEHILRGQGDYIYGPIIPSSWAYHPDLPKYEFDVERAKELLAEAGYEDGLTLELTFFWEPFREMAEILQYDFAQAGVNLEVKQVNSALWYELSEAGDIELGIQGWRGQTDPDRGVYRQFHSDNRQPAGPNWARYSNPEVDELLDKARAVTDVEERKALYWEIQEIVAEELPWIGYGGADYVLSAHNRSLQNFQYNGWFYFRQLYQAWLE